MTPPKPPRERRALQVGDRCAVYTVTDGRRVGVVQAIQFTGESDTSRIVQVNWRHPGAGEITGWYHPKQCRRLIKRKREPARRVWIYPSYFSRTPDKHGDIPARDDDISVLDPKENPEHHLHPERWIEFREVAKPRGPKP